MVSRIIISIALLCSSVAFSQEESALKFNQVLLVELTEEGVVVPEGKVWKVVSSTYDYPSYSNSGNYTHNCYFKVNNKDVMVFYFSNYNSATAPCNIFPLWLPSGTTLNLGSNITLLSIIEFNID
jgi:hypothetical protein